MFMCRRVPLCHGKSTQYSVALELAHHGVLNVIGFER